jgi:hypothetical protein
MSGALPARSKVGEIAENRFYFAPEPRALLQPAAAVDCRRTAGGVSAAGAGCLRVFGSAGACKGQFNFPFCCALDEPAPAAAKAQATASFQTPRALPLMVQGTSLWPTMVTSACKIC